MTLLQLQYFVALSETLHYTRASEKLHISQPSLSYAINELEKELGVKLFQKEKRAVFLTDYGQRFLPYVKSSLESLENGTHVVRRMAESAPQIVRFGYFHSVSVPLVPSIVDGFIRDNPSELIQFQFSEMPSSEVMRCIHDGALDFGISADRADWAESVAILKQPLYLAVPSDHPLADRKSVSLDEFSKESHILIERGTNIRANIDQLFSRHNITPHIAFEVRECNSAIQYVSLGFGVSIMSWVPAMESNRVRVLPIAEHDKELVRTVYLTYHKTRTISPEAKKVCDYIISNFAL